jgi:hypothetical protein
MHIQKLLTIKQFVDAEEMRAHCLGEDSLKESQQIVEKLADAIIKHKIKDTNQNR